MDGKESQVRKLGWANGWIITTRQICILPNHGVELNPLQGDRKIPRNGLDRNSTDVGFSLCRAGERLVTSRRKSRQAITAKVNANRLALAA